ncbi:glycosyltransferase, partial [Pseudomonas sp. GW531-E2]|uniref:glycosyltransferase n=1 Tax=Pseudomonas sp. GW531-E2 TaxID=2070679 RepID=UPI001C481F78
VKERSRPGERPRSRPNERPGISIITCVRNGAETLSRTIDSIRRQTFPDIEYIVVDGASTDGTLDVIKENLDAISAWISEPDDGI